MTTSLHNRMLFAENWGGVAIAALMVWTVFLPTGRRISVDAVLASMRARRNETPEELAAGVPAPDNTRVRSLAVLGLLLQIAIIYWFNYVHKSGQTWKDGTAVYYVLHQERIITWLGLQIREHVPYVVTKLLTHGTLVVEAAVPFLVLTPVFWRWTRPLALVLLVGLHGSIAAMVNLGIFSAAMIAYDPFLLDTVHWDLFDRLAPRKRRARLVFYDVDCGVCFFIARVAGAAGRVPAAAPGLEPRRGRAARRRRRELLDRTILVVDSERPSRRWTRGGGLRGDPARAAVRRAVVVAVAAARHQRARERLPTTPSRATGRASRPGSGWRRAACRARRACRGAREAADAAARVGAGAAAGRARARHRADVRDPGRRGVGGEPVDSALRSASSIAPSGWWRR